VVLSKAAAARKLSFNSTGSKLQFPEGGGRGRWGERGRYKLQARYFCDK